MIDQIGKYRIIKRLGQGGFGDVYLAEDTVLGSQVALKVLAAHYLRNPTVVERFRQEARAAARLRHPHIVRIYDLGEEEGVLYLAMDYLPGCTLAQLIADEGPLPLARTASLVTQLASALDHAHSQGLIHRDVKPGNVIVDSQDHATLTDFGLVKAVEGTAFSVLQITGGSGQFTSGGTMIGTPEYMAPEQADPSLGTIDHHTDIYALGVVTYQMLTGHVPFTASTPIAILRGHVDLQPPPPSQWVDLPSEVNTALMRALAKMPEERWGRASHLARVLAKAVQQQEADHAEEQEVARLYAQAEAELDRREWTRALSLCGQVMERHPGYEDVDALFLRANEGLVRQKQWEAQQQEMAMLYKTAEGHLQAEAWEEAIATLERITDISGEYVYRETTKLLARATAARERAEAQRRARAQGLREISLNLLQDLRSYLQEMADLLPDEPDLPRQRQLAEAMIARWSGESVDNEESLLEADGQEAEVRKGISPRLFRWLQARPWLIWLWIGITALLSMGLIAALALPCGQAEIVHHKILQIDSRLGWQWTDLKVRGNDQVTLKVVDGEWTHWQHTIPYNPGKGEDFPCTMVASADECLEPLPDFRKGALVGQIGDQVFGIAEGTSVIAEQSGVLSLRINDPDGEALKDNDGVLSVSVTVKRKPW